MQLKVHRIGDSIGVILPEEIVRDLEAAEGGTITVERTSDGYRLSAGNDAVARQLAIAEKIMDRYRNTLRELAK